MKEVKITVICMECLEEIKRPSDADMELFRQGIRIHRDCADKPAWRMPVDSRPSFEDFLNSEEYNGLECTQEDCGPCWNTGCVHHKERV